MKTAPGPNIFTIVVAVAAMTVFSPWKAEASTLQAAPLDPGDTVSPLPVFVGTREQVLQSGTISYGSPGVAGPVGTLHYSVQSHGPQNPYGGDEIIYLLTVSSDNVAAISLDGYSGFDTAVKACTSADCFDPGSVFAPSSAGRSADGDTVTFFFTTALVVGTESEFTIGTNATSFVDPPIYFTDSSGNTVTAEGLGPAATPLPGALPLFVSGLGALGLFGWRRKRPAVAA